MPGILLCTSEGLTAVKNLFWWWWESCPFTHQYESQALDCGLQPLLPLASALQGELRTTLEGMGGTVCDCSQEPLITFCYSVERDNWGNSLLLHPSRVGVQVSLTSTFCLLGMSQVSRSVGEARLFLGEAGHLWASHHRLSLPVAQVQQQAVLSG